MAYFSSPEPLEARIAPAAVVQYTDVDGDMVTIKTSLGTAAELKAVLTFSQPTDVPRHLDLVDLAQDPYHFHGTDLTITAVAAGGGDGKVNVGTISALANDRAWIDLGNVFVDGDVEAILAGDSNLKTPAVKSLTVGALGSVTHGHSHLIGPVRKVMIGGDLSGLLEVDGNVGSLTVTGAVRGGDESYLFGQLYVTGAVGHLSTGALIGAKGDFSGTVNVGDLYLDFPLTDGPAARAGTISIKGDLTALATGAGVASGSLLLNAAIQSLTVGGSVHGGDAFHSGIIFDEPEGKAALGNVLVTGDVLAGSAPQSGLLLINAPISSFTIQGLVDGRGGATFTDPLVTEANAQISLGKVGNLRIMKGLIAGADPAANAGTLRTGSVSSLLLGGLSGGAHVLINGTLQTALIQGDVTGTASDRALLETISSTGSHNIGSLTITGNVAFADLGAGAGPVAEANHLFSDPDAQIDKVVIHGNWTGTNLIAGASPGADGHYGTADDAAAAYLGTFLTPFINSLIGSVTIDGQVLATADGSDHFGIVSQEIGAVKIGGNSLSLNPGPANDKAGIVTPAADLQVREIQLF